jgi:hypothetical protein
MYFVADGTTRDKLVGRDFHKTMARVLEGPWGRGVSMGERAWMWAEAGYRDEAQRVLDIHDGPLDALGRIVAARLSL